MSTNDVHGDIAKALLEGSNWATAGLKVSEKQETETKVVAESTEEVFAEAEEVHSCPLCLTELTEAISDDQIVEHLDNVLTIMDVIEESFEGGEDDDEEEADDSETCDVATDEK
jgi:glutathionylspermidine synthase